MMSGSASCAAGWSLNTRTGSPSRCACSQNAYVSLHPAHVPISLARAQGKAGQTVMVERGTRFRPTFPESGTEYIPVCLPAFRPDRCLREDTNDDEQSAISQRLGELHNEKPKAGEKCAPLPEVLYHMCQVSLWEAAKAEGRAYFPPTFDEDGAFTHATGVPSRLIETANHFYQGEPGEWVCLRFSRSNLRSAGIVVRDEHALPVGDTPIGKSWKDWVCPHIVGGIPPSVVDAEMPMVRDAKGRAFLAIDGLVQNGKA